jgi:hypothetical protein
VPAAPAATLLEAASEEAAVELLDAPQAASAPAVTPLITAAEASFKKLLREIFFIACSPHFFFLSIAIHLLFRACAPFRKGRRSLDIIITKRQGFHKSIFLCYNRINL